MNVNRQDAWSKEEDLLLANTVLDYIKNGQTQLESFKKVAEQLNRTPAAYVFRWNATIRKGYSDEIEQAKKIRKKYPYKYDNKQESQPKQNSSLSTLDQAIHWLEKLKNESSDSDDVTNQKLNYQMIEENQRLKQELLVYETLINNMKKLLEEIE